MDRFFYFTICLVRGLANTLERGANSHAEASCHTRRSPSTSRFKHNCSQNSTCGHSDSSFHDTCRSNNTANQSKHAKHGSAANKLKSQKNSYPSPNSLQFPLEASMWSPWAHPAPQVVERLLAAALLPCCCRSSCGCCFCFLEVVQLVYWFLVLCDESVDSNSNARRGCDACMVRPICAFYPSYFDD